MDRRFFTLMTGLALLTAALASPFSISSQGPACPPQMGQVTVTIPAGEIQRPVVVPIEFCPKINIQLTGGSSVQLPIVLNARVHHGVLIITASLLKPEEGPVDVTVWWQVSFAN